MTAHDTPRTDERAGLSEAARALADYATACNEMDRLTSASGGPGQAWRWSIPANHERDSVLIFDRAIAHVPSLVARAEAAEAKVAAALMVMTQGPDGWEGYHSRDVGHVFHADRVLDFTDDLRAALAPTTGDAS